MRKFFKKIAWVIGACAVVFLAVVIGIYSYLYFNPEQLRATARSQLNRQFQQQVTLGEARLSGSRLYLYDLSTGTPESDLFVRADKIRVRFSLPRLFIGQFRLHEIKLYSPEAFVTPARLPRPAGRGKKFILPTFKVSGGTLHVKTAGQELTFDELSGLLSARRVDLEAGIDGGRLSLDARYLLGTWKGDLTLEGMDPGRVDLDYLGPTELHLHFAVGANQQSIRLAAGTSSLNLPGAETGMGPLTLGIKAEGKGGRINLQKLSLANPLISLEGSGTLTGVRDLKSLAAASLTLNLQSSTFDYESLVAALPAKKLPPFLNTALTRQIRGGTSRLRSVRYAGPVKALADPRILARNLAVRQELHGQSLGADFGPERVRDINGEVLLSGGDLIFRDLSGAIGSSTLDRVTITFRDITSPGLRIGVDTRLDMEASDFVDAWRAIMITRGLHDMLEPVTAVEGGRITVEGTTFWETGNAHGMLADGEVLLHDCSFHWQDTPLENINGRIFSSAFGDPLLIGITGKAADANVLSLDVTMEDAFSADRQITFDLLADHLPSSRILSLRGDSTLRLRGGGAQQAISGTADLEVPAFALMETPCRPREGVIRGSGSFTGSLPPTFRMDIPRMEFKTPQGRLTTALSLDAVGGSLKLDSTLDLGHFIVGTADEEHPLTGTIKCSGSATWGEKAAFAGTVTGHDAHLLLQGEALILDGTLHATDGIITTRDLVVQVRGMTNSIAGTLTLGPPPVFTGSLGIEGLVIGAEPTPLPEVLRTLEVHAPLRLTNLSLYGIPVAEVRADTTYKNSFITLENLVLRDKNGTVTGRLTLDSEMHPEFDVTIALAEAEMSDLVSAVSRNNAIAEGTINADGHLWGTPRAINGNLSLSSTDGRIRRYTFLSKLFSMLNVYRILTTGDIDLSGEGFPYNSISANLTFEESIATFSDFLLDSNSLQMSAVGSYNLGQRTLDCLIGIQPLETVDKTINLIPLLGWVLTGEEGRLLVVSLRVRGPVDDPTIVPAPIDTVAKPVGKTLLRVLKLPVDIILRPQDVILPEPLRKDQKDNPELNRLFRDHEPLFERYEPSDPQSSWQDEHRFPRHERLFEPRERLFEPRERLFEPRERLFEPRDRFFDSPVRETEDASQPPKNTVQDAP